MWEMLKNEQRDIAPGFGWYSKRTWRLEKRNLRRRRQLSESSKKLSRLVNVEKQVELAESCYVQSG